MYIQGRVCVCSTACRHPAAHKVASHAHAHTHNFCCCKGASFLLQFARDPEHHSAHKPRALSALLQTSQPPPYASWAPWHPHARTPLGRHGTHTLAHLLGAMAPRTPLGRHGTPTHMRLGRHGTHTLAVHASCAAATTGPASSPGACQRTTRRSHACDARRRRCCDGTSCPPCEERCGRKLKCGNHKCPAPCHAGPCRCVGVPALLSRSTLHLVRHCVQAARAAVHQMGVLRKGGCSRGQRSALCCVLYRVQVCS